MLTKYSNCPHCKELYCYTLKDESDYSELPEVRTYALTCLLCGKVVDRIVISNTLKEVKNLRDEIDTLYGKSIIVPMGLM